MGTALAAVVPSTIAPAAERDEYAFADDASALSFFADFALLVDRGIAITFFAPSADEYIVRRLAASESFRKKVGVSVETASAMKAEVDQNLATIAEGGKPVAQASSSSRGVVCEGFDQTFRLSTRDILQRQLTEAQQAELAGTYLNIEGLLALRRPWFGRELNLSEELQAEIAALASDRYILFGPPNSTVGNLGSLQLHRGMFAMSSRDMHELPKIISQLRMASASLDHEIVAMLSAEQKRLLAALTTRASNEMREIHSYTIGAPHAVAELGR